MKIKWNKIGKSACEIVFTVSLALLAKIKLSGENLMLPTYQVIVSIFWAAGILRFMGHEKEIKEEFIDSVKDFLIALLTGLFWYYISGDASMDVYEPISVMVHFAVLIAIIFLTYRSVKLSGNIAYYTHAVIPVIAVVLIKIGLPVAPAVLIAVILPEPVNYFFRKK